VALQVATVTGSIDTANRASLPSEASTERRRKGESEPMKVWIDQDLCTGDGLCEEIAPAVFTLLDDGLAYVKEGDQVKNEPGGSAGLALVPDDLEDAVTEAAEECPGECIFIEQG
jgi:ferredoxin